MKRSRILPLKPHQIKYVSAILIFIAVLCSFGFSIPALGLYGDQWNQVLVTRSIENGYLLEGIIKGILINLPGNTPALFHSINLFLWTIAGILFFRYQIHSGIRNEHALAGALLFVVFPAFNQPGAAFDLTPILLGLCLAFLSIEYYYTALDSGRNKYRNISLGVVCALLAMANSPFVALIEGMLVILSFTIRLVQTRKLRMIEMAGAGIHFIISVLILFVYYSPGKPGLSLASTALKQWMNTFLLSWRQIIAMPAGGEKIAIYLAVLTLSTIFLLYLLIMIKISTPKQENDDEPQLLVDITLISGSAILGLVFFFIMGWLQIPVGSQYPSDLGLSAISFLAVLLITSSVGLFFMEEYQMVILALLVVLAAGGRFLVTQRFTAESTRLNGFIQQLSARADHIEAGTRIVVEQLPFDYTSRRSLQALVRNQFGNGMEENSLAIVPADDANFREFLKSDSTTSFNLLLDEEEITIPKKNILAVWLPAEKCLEVIESTERRNDLPHGLALAARYSNPSLLISDNQKPASEFISGSTEKTGTWCELLQYAQRFSEGNHWEEVIQIYSAGEAKYGYSDYYRDYSPLIKAFIHTGRIPEAKELVTKVNTNPDVQSSLCLQWTQILKDTSIPKEVINEALTAQLEIGCE